MGSVEKEVFGYLTKPRTINSLANLYGMDAKRVRPAMRRLLVAGFVEKVANPENANEPLYKIRTDWTEADMKPKPWGKQGKAKPKPVKPKKRPLTQVLGVWV